MSQQNVDLVRRSYELWAARDLDGMLALIDPDVEIRSLLTEAERTSYRGREGFTAWYSELLGVFPDWDPTIEGIRTIDDSVVVRLRVNARAVGSGVPIDQTTWQVVRFNAGRAVRTE